MYRKKTKGWYKHKDFIFLDLCCIALAFLLADWIRSGTVSEHRNFHPAHGSGCVRSI